MECVRYDIAIWIAIGIAKQISSSKEQQGKKSKIKAGSSRESRESLLA